MTARRTRPRIRGRLVVVAGQCSGVGKTALVADIIRATPGLRWTAVKITAHGDVRVSGEREGAMPKRHTFSIREETDPAGRSDTSRFLAAGAVRSLWLQAKPGCLAPALESLKNHLAGTGNVIIESGAVVRYWKPDSLFIVLEPRTPDFKESIRRLFSQADVFVYRSPAAKADRTDWPVITTDGRRKSCSVLQPLGHPLPRKVKRIVRQPYDVI
jgi:hypothetical protein